MEWNISISRNLFLQGIPFLSVFLQPRKSMEKDSLSFLPYLIPDIWRKIDLLTKERKKMLWKQDFSSVLAQSIPSGRDIANSFPPCVEHRKMINYFAHVSLWCHPAKDTRPVKKVVNPHRTYWEIVEKYIYWSQSFSMVFTLKKRGGRPGLAPFSPSF